MGTVQDLTQIRLHSRCTVFTLLTLATLRFPRPSSSPLSTRTYSSPPIPQRKAKTMDLLLQRTGEFPLVAFVRQAPRTKNVLGVLTTRPREHNNSEGVEQRSSVRRLRLKTHCFTLWPVKCLHFAKHAWKYRKLSLYNVVYQTLTQAAG